jgi:hypothetical protein
VAGSALSNIDSEEGVKDLLKKVQSGLDTSQAAANIQALVDGGIETGPDGVPRFKDADVYGETANAANVGMAVMVLALAEINTINDETDLIDLLDHLDIGNGVVTIKGSPTQNEIALAAYLNLISREGYNRFDGNAITGGIKSAFNLSKEI